MAERTEEHRAALTGLRPATRYHYRVRSRGPDGTLAAVARGRPAARDVHHVGP